jgi:hypothetical protein
MRVKTLVETGVVEMVGLGEDGWTVEEVLHDCFMRYTIAKRTVQRNKPAAYIATAAKPSERANKPKV